MKSLLLSIPFFIIFSSLEITFAAQPFCNGLQERFVQQIKPQIEKGIPFDLVVLMRTASKVSCKTVIHIQYDLWKERVKFSKDGQSVSAELASKAPALLCEMAQCSAIEKANRPRLVQARVLLNPLWEGQSKGLIRTKQNSVIRFFKLEWDDLSQDLPKDLEIMNEEVLL